MHHYFSIELCLGPFSPLDEETLCQFIDELVDSYNIDKISSLWETFSFAENLLEEAAEKVGEESTLAQDELWLKEVGSCIKEALFMAAKSVYLKESFEATQRNIDGKSWILSGGQTWDGFTTAIAEHIKFVAWSGLDKYLFDKFNGGYNDRKSF